MTDDMEQQLAPHGRDETGAPIAPYGYKTDGTPRKDRRGARPGQKGNGNAAPASAGKASGARPTLSKGDQERVQTLMGLAEMTVVMPLIGASASPFLRKRLGEKHTAALAGDGAILMQFLEPAATAVVVAGATKPGALAWLDKVEEKAPYLMAMQVAGQLGKALVGNHLNPSPRLNNAGKLFAQMRAAQIAEQIEAEARAMGIPTSYEDQGADQADQYAEAAA